MSPSLIPVNTTAPITSQFYRRVNSSEGGSEPASAILSPSASSSSLLSKRSGPQTPLSPTKSKLPTPMLSSSSSSSSSRLTKSSSAAFFRSLSSNESDSADVDANVVSAQEALKNLRTLPRFRCKSIIQGEHGDKGVRCMIMVKGTMWGGARDGQHIVVQNVKNGRLIKKIGHPDEGKPRKVVTEKPRLDIVSLLLTADQATVWSGSSDGTIRLWEVETHQHVKWFKAHVGSVEQMVLSSDGNIWSASMDFSIKLWHGRSQYLMMTLTGHSNWVRAMAIVPEQSRIWSGSDDATIRVWDTRAGTESTLIHVREGVVSMLRVGDQIWAGTRGNSIKVYNADSLELVQTLTGHKGWVNCLAVVGEHVWSGSADRTLRVWDPKSLELLQCIEDFRGWVYSIAAAENVLWASCSDQKIRVYGVYNPPAPAAVPAAPAAAAAEATSPKQPPATASPPTPAIGKLVDAVTQTDAELVDPDDGIERLHSLGEEQLDIADVQDYQRQQQQNEYDEMEAYVSQLMTELVIKDQQIAKLHQSLEEHGSHTQKITELLATEQEKASNAMQELATVAVSHSQAVSDRNEAIQKVENMMDQMAILSFDRSNMVNASIQTDVVEPPPPPPQPEVTLQVGHGSTVDIPASILLEQHAQTDAKEPLPEHELQTDPEEIPPQEPPKEAFVDVGQQTTHGPLHEVEQQTEPAQPLNAVELQTEPEEQPLPRPLNEVELQTEPKEPLAEASQQTIAEALNEVELQTESTAPLTTAELQTDPKEPLASTEQQTDMTAAEIDKLLNPAAVQEGDDDDETSKTLDDLPVAAVAEQDLQFTCTICFKKLPFDELAEHSKTCAIKSDPEIPANNLFVDQQQKNDESNLDSQLEEIERVERVLRSTLEELEQRLQKTDDPALKFKLLQQIINLKDKTLANIIAQKMNALMRAAAYSSQTAIARREVKRLSGVILTAKLEEQYVKEEDIVRAALGNDLTIGKLQEQRKRHPIKMAGWLIKRSEHFRDWRRRFFILVDKYLLYYSSSKKDKGPKGVYVLNGVKVKKLVDKESNKPNSFRVSWPKREFDVAGTNEDERVRWMSVIEVASAWWNSTAYSEEMYAAEGMIPNFDDAGFPDGDDGDDADD